MSVDKRSMTVIRSQSRSARLLIPKNAAKRKSADGEKSLAGQFLNESSSDVVDAEFEEILSSAPDEFSEKIKSKYGQSDLPKFIFTKRFIDYYA